MNSTNDNLNSDTSEFAEVCPELTHFRDLEGFVDRTRRGKLESDALHDLTVRAAFSKCYEFNTSVRESLDDPRVAFCLPSLRGICEDVIVLGYLHKIPSADRNDLIRKLMIHSTAVRTRIQSQFFNTVRPQQPVLATSMLPNEVKEVEDDIRSIWRSNGWPNLNRGVMPPTQEIAQKQGSEILLRLYDYLYRLTSGMVHFDVQSLWKTGWGDPPNFEFSVQHFRLYYAGFARTYGAFLFVSYIELFSDLLNPSDNDLSLVDEIRKWLYLTPRWPEMVTFEEMNLTPPKCNPLLSIVTGLIQHEKSPRLLG